MAAQSSLEPAAKRFRSQAEASGAQAEESGVVAVGSAAAGPQRFSMGSVCSGIGTCHRAMAAIQACNPGLQVSFAFACEKDRAARKVLLSDFPAAPLFDDVCTDSESFPACDVLTAGWPCQPFSAANRKRKGLADVRCRVLPPILQYIQRAKPRIVILENVPGLLIWGRELLLKIGSVLQAAGYSLGVQVLDSHIHGGVPQHRRRLFIVAVLSPTCNLDWPCPTPMLPLRSILSDEVHPASSQPSAPKAAVKLNKVKEELRAAGCSRAELCEMVVNCHSQLGALFVQKTPCLTAARGPREASGSSARIG